MVIEKSHLGVKPSSTSSVYIIPQVIQTSVNFSLFNFNFNLLKVGRVTKVKVFFLVLVYVFDFS